MRNWSYFGKSAITRLAVAGAGPALLAIVLVLGIGGFILFGDGKAIGVEGVMNETSSGRDVSPTPSTPPKDESLLVKTLTNRNR